MDNASIEILGSAIHMQPEMKGNKEVIVSLVNAVAKENNCDSVISAQKVGQKSVAKLHETAKDKSKDKGKGKGKGIEPEVQAVNDASSKPISGAK